MKRFNTDSENLLPAFQQDWGTTYDNVQEALTNILGTSFSVVQGLEFDTETETLTDGYVMMNGILRYVPAGLVVGAYITENDELTDIRSGLYVYTTYKAKNSAVATSYPTLTLENIAKYRLNIPFNWDFANNVEKKVVGKTWNGKQVYAKKVQGTFAIGEDTKTITNLYGRGVTNIIFASGEVSDGLLSNPLNKRLFNPAEISIRLQTVEANTYPVAYRTDTAWITNFDIYIEYTKSEE